MSEEEKKAINLLKSEILDSEKLFEEVGCYKFFNKDRINAVKVILNLVKNNAKTLEKQQKEIEELNSEFAINTEIHKRDMKIKELEEVNNCLHETNNNYISKDEVLKALGYEENGEEYKRIYNKEELILSLIRTINEECDRLEYIEDQKTMLEIHNIENQRDKYWENKIRDKIKELEKEKEKYKGDKGLIYSQVGFIQSGINALNKLLEEK